jgi:hypothetical protein
MGISRDTVVVEVGDYSKPCPAVLVARRTEKGDADAPVHTLHVTVAIRLEKCNAFTELLGIHIDKTIQDQMWYNAG